MRALGGLQGRVVPQTTRWRIGGVGLQTVRDPVLAFTQKGPGKLINGKAPSQPSKLTKGQRRALAAWRTGRSRPSTAWGGDASRTSPARCEPAGPWSTSGDVAVAGAA